MSDVQLGVGNVNAGVEEAVLLEPMGVAHNAIERLEVAGEAVLVIGCGAVGLLGTSVAKSLGATRYHESLSQTSCILTNFSGKQNR